jgi:Protein of unknown function (DUF4236)
MGWNFRRSLNLGPLRLNLSTSGVGYSVGGRGFRLGKDAKGRVYSACGIPGTGIYRRDYLQTAAAIPPTPSSPRVQVNTSALGQRNTFRSGALKRLAPAPLYVAGALILYLLIRSFS